MSERLGAERALLCPAPGAVTQSAATLKTGGRSSSADRYYTASARVSSTRSRTGTNTRMSCRRAEHGHVNRSTFPTSARPTNLKETTDEHHSEEARYR